jgi:hypothetical protein
VEVVVFSRGHHAEQENRKIGLGVWRPLKDEASPVEWLVHRQ